MPTRRQIVEKNLTQLETLEDSAARRVAAAYDAARVEIIGRLLADWPSGPLSIADAMRTWRQLALLAQLNAGLDQLENKITDLTPTLLSESTALALKQIEAEIGLLPPDLGIGDPVAAMFAKINPVLIAQIGPVIQ